MLALTRRDHWENLHTLVCWGAFVFTFRHDCFIRCSKSSVPKISIGRIRSQSISFTSWTCGCFSKGRERYYCIRALVDRRLPPVFDISCLLFSSPPGPATRIDHTILQPIRLDFFWSIFDRTRRDHHWEAFASQSYIQFSKGLSVIKTSLSSV